MISRPRYDSLQAQVQSHARELRSLPFYLEDEQSGDKIVVDQNDVYLIGDQAAEVYTYQIADAPGWRGWLWREEPTLFRSDGQKSQALDPRGKARDADFPGGTSFTRIRQQIGDSEQLLEKARQHPLGQHLADLPFGSYRAARAVIEASAPALPGAVGTAALAAAMITAAPRELQDDVLERLSPSVVEGLKKSDTPSEELLEKTVSQTPAILPALAQLLGKSGKLSFALAREAARGPQAHTLAPLLLDSLPDQELPPLFKTLKDEGIWDERTRRRLLSPDFEKDPMAAAGQIAGYQREATAKTKVRRLFIGQAADSCEPGQKQQLLRNLAAIQVDDRSFARLTESVLAQLEEPPMSILVTAVGRVDKSDQVQVFRSLSRGLESPELANAEALTHLSYRGDYRSFKKTLQAYSETQGSPMKRALATMGTLGNEQNAAVFQALLPWLKDGEDPVKIGMLEALSKNRYPGDYESFRKTCQRVEDAFQEPQQPTLIPAPERALRAAVGSVQSNRAQDALQAALDSVPVTDQNRTLLNFTREMAKIRLPGDYESHKKTFDRCLDRVFAEGGCAPYDFLQTAMNSVSSHSHAGVLRAGLDSLDPAHPQALSEKELSWLRTLSETRFPGDYESLKKAYDRGLEAARQSQGKNVIYSWAVTAATNSRENTAKRLIQKAHELQPDLIELRFLNELTRVSFPGDYESFHKSMKYGVQATRDKPGGLDSFIEMAKAATRAAQKSTRPAVVRKAFEVIHDERQGEAKLFAPKIPSNDEIEADPDAALESLRTVWLEIQEQSPEAEREIDFLDDVVVVGDFELEVQ